MASQLYRLRGQKYRPYQVDEVNAQKAGLYQSYQNKLAAEQRTEDARRYEQDYNLKTKQLSLQNEAAKKTMGVEAAKLGLNLASTFKDKNLGSMFGGKLAGTSLSGINPAGIVGGGLAGFGAASAFGGKSKLKKAGIGATAGGLIGALTGGGAGYGSGIMGAISGGIGGLFG